MPSPPRRARLLGLGAALFGGLMVHAAIPTLNLAVTALFAWVPALYLARALPWRRRLRLGWLLGFCADAITFAFISFTMEHMTSLPAAAGAGLVVLYAAWHGLLGGIFLALAEPARRAAESRLRGAGPVAVALTYAAVDWLWPQVFPLSIGHSFWQVGPVASVAALTGVPGLAFLVLLVNASLADLWRTRRPRRLLLSGAVLVALLGFGVGWYAHVHAVTPSRVLRVAVLQPNYTLEEKKRAAGRLGREAVAQQRRDFLTRLDAQLRALPRDRYDLVVGPEGAFPYNWRVDVESLPSGEGAPRDALPTRLVARAVAEGPHAHTLLGGLRRGPDGHTRNAAVHFAPDGMLLGYYDKQTLMAFGEYLPARGVFEDLFGEIHGIANLEPGDRACGFEAGAVKVACGICYESVFAGSTRDDIDDASLLVNLTIDTWFGTTNAPESHLMLQASRAVELGVPLVRAALTGITAVVGPDGQVEASLPRDVAGTLSVDVPLYDLSPPFRAVGPVFAWLALVVTFSLLALAFVRRRELWPPTGVVPSVRREGDDLSLPSRGAPDDAGRPRRTADN
ncbi:MAG: apolipoprotein N-acyltransferase [Deltaproteobacteria bacterium]|nr:MAG: apolipoprotein N-acyltransferase [Deltaproteobacteria bacterium]